jgi:hypothetical protein
MEKSISFLLGAGFSAPKGYPIGNGLNNLILKTKVGRFGMDSKGELFVKSRKQNVNALVYKNTHEIGLDICLTLVRDFKRRKKYFDYEQFFDYLTQTEGIEQIDFLSKNRSCSRDVKNALNQIVSYYLKDENNKQYYDDEPQFLGYYQKYRGLHSFINGLPNDIIVDFHTLNHDLFFESLNRTDTLKNELCDGFEELGSPYYGELNLNSRKYHCRLSHYTGKYNKRFRLYKLHGSLDYAIYWKPVGGQLFPEKYVKVRRGISIADLKKEITKSDGSLGYESCWINYHSDFLTGSTSKIERYNEKTLYKKLFKLFKSNLKKAEKLVIIGYGGRDKEINRILMRYFDYKSKPVFIVDPFPGKTVMELKEKMNAKLIKRILQNVDTRDFE